MGRRRNRAGSKLRIVISCFVFLFVLAAGLVVGFNAYLNASVAPVNAASTDYVSVNIPSGASTVRIGEILESYDLIRNPLVFRFVSRRDGYDGRLRAGDYILSPSMSAHEILTALTVGGRADTKRFTVPEGLRIERIAERLADEGLVDEDRFLYLLEHGDFDFRFMSHLPEGPNRFEGFLFPETYDVFVNATEEDIISRMLAQFERVFTDEYYERVSELGFTLHEIITIASLIEAETRVAEERPVVASVIYNRLAIGMQLQLCSTVQYALGEVRPRLFFRDLEIDHPYNTYRIPALPPGPICSPGERAIHAALFPDDTEYLFFVLKPDGSGGHNFSRTLAEHNRYAQQLHNTL